MKKILFLLLIFLFISNLIFAQGTKVNNDIIINKETTSINPSGYYVGLLKVNDSIKLPIVFEFKNNKVFFSSPSQNANDLEVSYEINNSNNITIEAKKFGFYVEGILSETDLKGTFYQSGLELNIELRKQDTKTIEKPIRLQTPTSFNYMREEVKITNPKNNREYFGTFTIPNKNASDTAVLFITGSGIQDRDEEIFNHKPFLVISDFLTRNGYYTLRCDDYGFRGEDISNQTTLDIIEDINAQIDYLKNIKNIKKIVLLGHSEGGIVSQALANKVNAIILLSSPSISGKEIYKKQVIHLLENANVPEMTMSLIENEIDKATSALTNNLFTNEEKKKIVFKYLKLSGNNDETAQAIYQTLSSPWYVTFLKLDPRNYIKQIKVPTLVLQGEKDTQVDSEENIKVFKELLKSENKIIVYPSYNHLLQKCKTGEVSEYDQINTTIEENVLSDILNFLIRYN